MNILNKVVKCLSNPIISYNLELYSHSIKTNENDWHDNIKAELYHKEQWF